MINIKILRRELGSCVDQHRWALHGYATGWDWITGPPEDAARAFIKFMREYGAPTHERYVKLGKDGQPLEPNCFFVFMRPEDGTRFTISQTGEVRETV